MTTAKSKAIDVAVEETIYSLKIGIVGAKPPIWRRVLTRPTATLSDLHRVIQVIMGWQESHLHQFELPLPPPDEDAGEEVIVTGHVDRIYRWRDRDVYVPKTDPLGNPFDWMDDDYGDESTVRLCDILFALGAKRRFTYTYDMGDSWDHEIIIEQELPADPEADYPVCVTGKRNGLIEDCGGIWGYEELLAILADPKHEDYAERKEWLGECYGVSRWDADKFDLEGINRRLKPLRPRRRKKKVTPASALPTPA